MAVCVHLQFSIRKEDGMRYARHRRRTWAERNEELVIALIVVIIGLLMGSVSYRFIL